MDCNSKREVIAATFDRLRRHLRMYEMFDLLERPKDARDALLNASETLNNLDGHIDDENRSSSVYS